MKHWIYETHLHNGGVGLSLLDGGTNRVIQLQAAGADHVVFAEQCDGEFDVTMSRADAVAALREAIAWIETGCPALPGATGISASKL